MLRVARASLVGFALSGTLALANAPASSEEARDGVKWDPEASKELTAELHRMHQIWNDNDIESLKKLMIGDDVLVTFELDPSTHAPIRLGSKTEIDGFIDRVIQVIRRDGGESELEMPALSCRATKTFGICTEECVTHLKRPDGTEIVDKLWSTTVAVKTDSGWRWIQWHMSVASPSQVLKDGKPLAASSILR